MNHMFKIVNASDFQYFLANELYNKHPIEWFFYKIDCLDVSSGMVKKSCAYQGALLWTIIFLFCLNFICKIICYVWRQYIFFKRFFEMVNLKNPVAIEKITKGGRVRKSLKN